MSITTPRVLVIVEAAKPDVLDLNIMSPVAVERIEKWYSWQAKANQISKVYNWLRTSIDGAPDFGFLGARSYDSGEVDCVRYEHA